MNEDEIKKKENSIKDNNEIDNKDNKLEKYLLPPKSEDKINLKTLVLDLDETLAHGQNIPFSSPKNQLTIECKLNDINTTIYFKIRPGVKEFLRKMSKLYEIVIFTASVEEYAKMLINLIDTKNICSHKLYREQCTYENFLYIKDLRKLGRDLKDIIIIDNSPNAYSLNKENGIPISTWLDDENDRELYDLIQILEFLSYVDDVRTFIPKFVIGDEISFFASMDIIKKYKNINFKNSNLSAINFHPFMNDSGISHQITENNHSIILENTINKEENNDKLKDDINEKEKDLIDYSENLFDDIILNENINKTDFDININKEMDLIKKEENKKENKQTNENENDIKINNDTKNKNKKDLTYLEGKNENINIEKKEKNNKNTEASKTKNNKNQKEKKKKIGKTVSNKNKREVKHNKSSSLVINTISKFNLLMPKSKKENILNNKMNLTIKNIKSKTVKRPKTIKKEENSNKKSIRPRNIITEFKPLKTLNNSTESLFNKKNLKMISITPKKIKDKNKLKNRILTQINQDKEKLKDKTKENSILKNTIKIKNNNEINKKELIKQRKKTPFRVHPKKEKQNNISKINNKSLKETTDKVKSNKIINYRNKNNVNDIGNNKKESLSLIKSKNKEYSNNKTINNNHISTKSTKQFHIKYNNIKKIENRLPWGWGGYTIKLSDFDNIFNYNVESREIRIAKLDLNVFKRAKSCKPSKKEKDKEYKDSKDNNIKIKRGKSSSNSTNITINKNDNKK